MVHGDQAIVSQDVGDNEYLGWVLFISSASEHMAVWSLNQYLVADSHAELFVRQWHRTCGGESAAASELRDTDPFIRRMRSKLEKE